jgi:hypothetical protein
MPNTKQSLTSNKAHQTIHQKYIILLSPLPSRPSVQSHVIMGHLFHCVSYAVQPFIQPDIHLRRTIPQSGFTHTPNLVDSPFSQHFRMRVGKKSKSLPKKTLFPPLRRSLQTVSKEISQSPRRANFQYSSPGDGIAWSYRNF